MTNSFKVGAPDDAEDPVIMRTGILADNLVKKCARKTTQIARKHGPENMTAARGVQYQWHALVSLAAYAIAMLNWLLTSSKWRWGDGEAHTIEVLFRQVEDLARKFYDGISKHHPPTPPDTQESNEQ